MQLMRCAVFLLSTVCSAHLHLAQYLPGPVHHTDASPEQEINHHTASLNNACEPLMIGNGPVPDIDTPHEFKNFTTLFATARIAPTPLGYKLVGQAQNGSVYGKVYHGVYYLDDYKPELCAAECDDNVDCSSFNICM